MFGFPYCYTPSEQDQIRHVKITSIRKETDFRLFTRLKTFHHISYKAMYEIFH